MDHEKVSGFTRLPEGSVAGAVACGGLERGVLCDFASGRVDAEDMGGVKTEVGEDQESTGGVENGVVDVRSVSLLGLGAGSFLLVADVLEKLESAVLHAESGEAVATVVGDGEVLVVVVQLSRHGATAGNVDEGRLCQGPIFQGEGVEARVVGCVPRLVDGDGLALQAEIDPSGLWARLRGLRNTLQSLVGELKGLNVAVGVASGRTVAANEQLDRRGGSRHTGEKQSAERHCGGRTGQRMTLCCCGVVGRMLCGERRTWGNSQNLYRRRSVARASG